MNSERSERSGFRLKSIRAAISREDFLRKFFRAGLMLLLGFVAFILGDRITRTNDCSSCPGNGSCKGETDCSKFMAEKT